MDQFSGAQPNAPSNGKLLRMCSWCKKIEMDQTRWSEVEDAVDELRLFERDKVPGITHGVCPSCSDQLMASLAGPADP